MAWRKSFIVLAFILCTAYVSAQADKTVRWDSLLNTLAENNQAMASIAVSQNGKVIYTKATGYSFINSDSKIPATTKTKYRIGSVTKMFTAVIIFQLIEEGKLSLFTPLNQYFPALPNSQLITVQDLLSHRSGLHNITDDPDYQKWKVSPKTHEEMLSIISGSPVDFVPGSKAAYCNSNFILLGYIIEKVCGHPYSEVLKDRVTSKAKLHDTYYGGMTDIVKNESYSYDFTGAWVQDSVTDPSVFAGAGAIVSTPSDLVKFMDALWGGRLVSPNSLEQMKTIIDGFGMGMLPMTFGTKSGYGHFGNIDGFSSSLSYFPDDGLCIAYCTNGQVYQMNDVLAGVLNIYFDKPYSMPVFKVGVVQK